MHRTVKEFMVKSVVELTDTESVGAARQRMANHDIGAVPVVNSEGALAGIVTATDLVTDYDDVLPVSRIMSSPVRTIEPNAKIAEAAHWMREHGHHHLVVVDQGKVVGIISSLDLLRVIDLGAVVD